MAKSVFTAFKYSKNAQKATEQYKDAPFDTLLGDAKDGVEEAIYYILLSSMGPVISVFKKYFLGNQSLTGDQINDLSSDYLAEVYEDILRMSSEEKGPLYRFDPNTFSNKDTDFLLNKLKYYIYRYCEKVAKRIKNEQYSTDSAETMASAFDDDEGGSYIDNIQSPDYSNSQDFSGFMGDDFITWLRMRNTRYADFLTLLMYNIPKEKIMQKMGFTSRQRYSAVIDSIAEAYSKYLKEKDE